jgi:uncharacterized OB-fold protein
MFDSIDKLQIENIYSEKKVTECYKCPTCGQLHYPAVLVCKACGYRRYPEDETEFVWSKKEYLSWERVPLEGNCTLVTWTRLWALPVGFNVRYVDFAIVQFENGLKAIGHLDCEKPKAGMVLSARTEKLRIIDGKDFYGLIFR